MSRYRDGVIGPVTGPSDSGDVVHDRPARFDRKLLYTVEDVAEQLSIGRTVVFRLIRDGQLQSVKIGSRRLVARSSVEAFVRSLLEAS